MLIAAIIPWIASLSPTGVCIVLSFLEKSERLNILGLFFLIQADFVLRENIKSNIL